MRVIRPLLSFVVASGGSMRVVYALVASLSLLSLSVVAQDQSQTALPQSDAQALSALQTAFSTMGGTVPSDATLSGTITLTAGTRTESGTINVLMKGASQSSERVASTFANQTVIYSNGSSELIVDGTSQVQSMEGSQSGQSVISPLPILAQLLSSPTIVMQTVGSEDVNGTNCLHVRTWNSFSTRPNLQFLVSFTQRDFWIESATGLVRRLSYEIREAEGAAPRTSIDVYYDDYRNIGGILFSFGIRKSMNGTPWATITLQTVQTNTGITDASFQVQ